MVAFFPGPLVAADGKPGVEQRLKNFAAEKEKHARDLAKEHQVEVSPEIWEFFKTAKDGNWQGVTNKFGKLKIGRSEDEGSKMDTAFTSPLWSTVLELELIAEYYLRLGSPFLVLMANDLMSGIPKGAVCLGGTDPGRGLPTAFSESHVRGEPFFTISQNNLADGNYLAYLRSTYGQKLKMPSIEVMQRCFKDYLDDAGRRAKHDLEFPNEPRQVKLGEDIRWEENRLTVKGQVAVMAINALLVKDIFDKNPDREFFVEESFPLEWMYPHLTPHGAILKLNRQPVARLTAEVIAKDRAFWDGRFKQLMGDWLTQATTVKEVCDFVERAYVRRDLTDFKGDRQYLANGDAQKAYSKLRSAQAGLYYWRINSTADSPDEQAKMTAEADFAFRQAFALCPSSPEALFRYTNLLISRGNMEASRGNTPESLRRVDDAIRLAQTAFRVDPKMPSASDLSKNLAEMRRQFEQQAK